MKLGDTFLGGLPGETGHLWMIATPVNADGDVVIVNFSSKTIDQACLVQPGEHPFVTKPTTVRYQFARIMPLALLERAAARGLLKPHQPLSPELLRRIQQGALQSQFTPGKVVAEVKRASGS